MFHIQLGKASVSHMRVNKAIKKYLKSVQRQLPCSYLVKKAIIKELRQTISEDYENQNVTLEELTNKYGTPEEIAEGFQCADSSKRLHKRVVIMRAAIACAVAIVVILAVIAIVLACTSGSDTYTTNYYLENSKSF